MAQTAGRISLGIGSFALKCTAMDVIACDRWIRRASSRRASSLLPNLRKIISQTELIDICLVVYIRTSYKKLASQSPLPFTTPALQLMTHRLVPQMTLGPCPFYGENLADERGILFSNYTDYVKADTVNRPRTM